MDVSELIPRKARLYGYLVVVLLGVVLGAVTVAFATATGGVPVAVTVAAAVYAFLSTAAPVVALFNLNKPLTDGDGSWADELPSEAPAPQPRQFH